MARFKFALKIFLIWLVMGLIDITVPDEYPKPKQVTAHDGMPLMLPAAHWQVADSVQTHFTAVVDALKARIKLELQATPLVIEVLPTISTPLPSEVLSALNRPEAYWLSIRSTGIRIVGANPLGALHGLTQLERLLGQGGVKPLPILDVLDWPDLKVRALHICISKVALDDMRQLITKARLAGMNTLILELDYALRLPSMERLASDDAWSPQNLQDIAAFARANGLEVIPQIPLLTHQEVFFRNKFPELMFNKATYNPQKSEIYAIVFPILDEVIALLHPRAIHIGHDELFGWKSEHMSQLMTSGEQRLPPELFLTSVQRLHDHLQQRGVETWMWGDMLLDPAEFPTMTDKALLGVDGYAALRSRIPKNVVICDWHYIGKQTDFPSATTFATLGHSVVGTTWKDVDTIRNFSHYIAAMPKGGRGMIATTWFHVQRKEWDIVHAIIARSGEAFWNAR